MAGATHRRTIGVSVALAAVASALNWWASSMPWLRVSGDAAGLTADLTLSADRVAPLQPGTALLGGASVIALLTLSERVLRVAMLAVAVMAASCAGQIAALMNPARRDALADSFGARAEVTVNAAALMVAGAGALALLAVSIVGFTARGARPTWSRRYERAVPPATGTAQVNDSSSTGDAHDLWRALDRGEDPT